MAAYAAVISLKHTIHDLLKSSRATSSREILEFAYNEASSLQQVLEGLNDSTSRSRSSWERLDALEGQIRDCAYKLEDVVEFHELKLEEEGEEEDGDGGVMREEISSFGETAKMMEKEYIQELSRDNDEDDDGDATIDSSDIDFGVEMIGRSRLFDTILRSHVLYRMRPDDMYIYGFWGDQGSGSRLVAKTVFEEVREKFECWGWARVGANYELKQVLMSVISQVVDNELLLSDDNPEEELSKYLYKALENRRYMIVLDDVDDVELVAYMIRTSFPDQSNGSVVFTSSNLEEVAASSDLRSSYVLPDMYENNIWFAMRRALFGGESIPVELEVAGRKIVHISGCQYISAAKILLFLSKTDNTVQQWSKIAADKENPIFMIVDEILEINEIKEKMQYCKREIVEQASRWLDHSRQVEGTKMKMYPQRFFSKMQIISFFGMAGIGKTTFARNIFKDDSTFSRFDHDVWIHTSTKYQSEEILIDILTQIFPSIHKLDMKAHEKLIKELCAQVSYKKCLIVLDDLCSKEPLLHLRKLFSNIKGTILVTTRLPKVAEFERDDTKIEMQLLDEEESWCLLREKVFDGGSCSPELEKAGRKIAEKCDSLPLLILTVAVQLCKVEQSEEHWNSIASGKEKSVFKSAHHQISEALLPSCRNLPQHPKPCFLYAGVFLEKIKIPKSDLTNMWISEGFLKPNLSHKEEDLVEEYLSELVDVSHIMVQRKVSSLPITTCRLHSAFWHLSNGQAVKNKFFHSINSYDDCSIENMEGERKLCIRNNILLGMRDVQKSIALNISAHSLLCVGPFHRYPMP